MKKTNKIIILVVLIAIMLLGIGYAAIQNITLNIGGTATADPNQSNFKVKFSGTPTTSDASKVTAAITDDINATINVSGLTTKGETVTATYTVQNASTDLSTDLSVATTNSNTDYFTLKADLAKTSLVAGEATTLTVTVELTKIPILETVSSTIGIQLTAMPVEPGQEGTSENINGSSQTPDNSIIFESYIPTGFSHVIGTNLKNGYTIQDSNGNQYVWVEVPQTAEVYPTAGLEITNFTSEEYNRIETDLHTYTTVYRKGTSYTDTWHSEELQGIASANEYNELKQKMLKSVYQNGGFYVGKYETGINYNEGPRTSSGNATQTPVIQANAYPYNYVTNKQAQQLASGMESGEYTTSLMFGVQWDLVLKYLETKGVEQAELKDDSTNIGNYGNNNWSTINTSAKYYKNNWNDGIYNKTSNEAVLLTTGADSAFCKQGIYDLAGNIFEWTLEYSTDSYYSCAERGGNYSCQGNTFPVSVRNYCTKTSANIDNGFRTALY